MAPSSLKETSVLSASEDREGFTFASVFLSFHSYWPCVQRAGTETHLLAPGMFSLWRTLSMGLFLFFNFFFFLHPCFPFPSLPLLS